MFSERARQLVHIGVGLLALLLRWLTWWQASLVAVAGIVFNVSVLPRIAPGLFRPGDAGRVRRSGIAIYPMAVLALILCFHDRLDLAATAWVILAFGDGAATLVGAHVRSAPLPWNRRKSAAGLAAFVVAAAGSGAAIAWWVRPAVPGLDASHTIAAPAIAVLAAPVIAAVVAGLVETLPIALNDNITVPAVAAAVLWALSFVHRDLVAAAWPIVRERAWAALGVNVIFAAAGWAARTVTPAGAIVGAAIGIATWLGTGGAGWSMLFAAFLAAALSTRAGFRRKAALGIAEGRGGRRGPANAIANTSLAAAAATLSIGVGRPDLARIAMVAALTAAAADTVASEVGKAWGRTTWLLPSFTRVAPGTSGAVSAEGTVANAAAAAILAAVGAALGLVPATAILPITAAGVVASLIEGVLGATFEASGTLDNDVLNFLTSAFGAAIAIVLWLQR